MANAYLSGTQLASNNITAVNGVAVLLGHKLQICARKQSRHICKVRVWHPVYTSVTPVTNAMSVYGARAPPATQTGGC